MKEIPGDPNAAVRVVNTDGSVNSEELEKRDAKDAEATNDPLIKRVTESRLAEISEKIEDPNFSQVDLGKLIAVEMASILQAMNTILDNVTRPGTAAYDKLATKEVVGSLNEQLKGVRELGKQIADMDSMAKRDYINFDGEKFRWIAGEWMKLGAEAVRAMGMGETSVHSWKNHFRQQLDKNQDRIRRDADKQVWLDEEKNKAKQTGAGN